MRKYTTVFSSHTRLLQVGPEQFVSPLLASCDFTDYVSLDISKPATVRGDLTRLCFADETFDIIYVAHVLEQIPDDRSALRELFRTLRPTGQLILQDPIVAGITRENLSITDPCEQERLFGHPIRIRVYGEDYFDRLAEAGFCVQKFTVATAMSPALIRKCGLDPSELISLCSKEPRGLQNPV